MITSIVERPENSVLSVFCFQLLSVHSPDEYQDTKCKLIDWLTAARFRPIATGSFLRLPARHPALAIHRMEPSHVDILPWPRCDFWSFQRQALRCPDSASFETHRTLTALDEDHDPTIACSICISPRFSCIASLLHCNRPTEQWRCSERLDL